MTKKDDQKWIVSKQSSFIGGLLMLVLALGGYIFNAEKTHTGAEFLEVKESIKNIERNTASIPVFNERITNVETRCDKYDIELADLKKKMNQTIMDVRQLITTCGRE